MGRQFGVRIPGGAAAVVIGLALSTAQCASQSAISGGGTRAPAPWLLGAIPREAGAPSGLLAEMLAFRTPSRGPLPDEIAAVAATPSLRLLAILGQYDMSHPLARRAAFSRDGRSLFSIGRDSDLTIWDAVSRTVKVRASLVRRARRGDDGDRRVGGRPLRGGRQLRRPDLHPLRF